ncbi:hypothetical protein [Absidia glauca]|uniref:Uncharacterized protein n=1 Tax=Absidia glauca TaxID=4829 RepID=A0A168Q833_ABSGL|nr:hypothetical protein [Absidia glauca]
MADQPKQQQQRHHHQRQRRQRRRLCQQQHLENLLLTTQQQLEDLRSRQVSLVVGNYQDFLRQALGQEDVEQELHHLKLHAKATALLMLEMLPEDADMVWGAVHQLSKQWGIEHLENLLEENGLPAFQAAREWVARTLLAQSWRTDIQRVHRRVRC